MMNGNMSKRHVDQIETNSSMPASTSSASHPKSLVLSNDICDDSTLSPKSPSSMFTKTVLEDSRGCFVNSIALCYWDNIVGPRVRHLWTKAENNSLKRDTLSYIASHTLSGEICRENSDAFIDSKFYIVKERDLVVTAFIFSAVAKAEFGVHSLCVLLPHKDLSRYLTLHELCETWLMRLVRILRVLLEKESFESAIFIFTTYLQDFVEMIKSLREAAVPTFLPLSDTAFHPEHKFKRSFLMQAITAHLMTGARSVVVGRSASRMNLMIATLALFVTASERQCSRYVVPDRSWHYVHDLYIQGLFKNSDLGRFLREVPLSVYPTALIDVGTEEVKVSGWPHEHRTKHFEALKLELENLWRRGHSDSVYPTNDIFHSYDDPETLVKNFVDEMSQLPATPGVKEAYIEHFSRLLERKALALIKQVEAESKCGKISVKAIIKKLKQDLSLTVPGDFKIVLATAERLKPGIYSFVCGQVKDDRQHIQNMMEGL